MPILACGINHKKAPIALREKVVFLTEKLPLYLNDLLTQENISEAVILSTCNRSEVYCNMSDVARVIDWFCSQHQIARHEIEPYMVYYHDQAAVEHIMNVACGLDSMVLGESQILSQMKQAFSESCAAGSIGPLFNRLFQQVFSVSKEIRTNTAIGACPVSVSSAAVQFIKDKIEHKLDQCDMLLIGAGVTIELILRHLKNNWPKRLRIVNRHVENAETLAKRHDCEVIDLKALSTILPETDVIITATGASSPIITPAMINKRQKPLWIIDIAVPRDVLPIVGDLDQVNLYSIDDLKNIIQKNLTGREHAADKAREVIKQKSQAFMTWLHSLDLVATTIKSYRRHIEDLCHRELSKSMRQLNRGDDPVLVLASFAHALTNKLLHTPSVQLRQAGDEGRLEFLQLVQQFFIPIASEF